MFQEQVVGALDVGETWIFKFDAKRGNINDPDFPDCPCSTTAVAFIKTLDPANGFVLTNFLTIDTTDLPDAWGSFELSIEIDETLSDQILQFGFANTATLFEPSGVFYDNVMFGVDAGDPPVPAVSTWGMMILIALFLGIPLLYMRRRAAQA